MNGEVVAMVPARGGSKGLPGKNTRPLGGKPMLAWSVEAALACPWVDAVFVDSDDPDCLRIGRELGAEAYHRPDALAADDVTMQAVVADFAEHLNRVGHDFRAVIVLYPTYPLRTADDLTAILERFFQEGGDRPLLGLKRPRNHPYLFYTLDADRHPRPFLDVDVDRFYRRQDYPPCYELTHFACVLPLDQVHTLNAQLQNDRTVGMLIEHARTVDVDSREDFELAEARLGPDRVLASGAVDGGNDTG